MRLHSYSALLRNPALTDLEGMHMLEEMVDTYPYCQSALALYACHLSRNESLQFPVWLRRASASSGNRKVLKGLITQQEKRLIEPEEVRTAEEQIDAEALTDYGAVSRQELDSIPADEMPQPNAVVFTWEIGYSGIEPPRRSLPDIPSHERMTQEELLSIVKKRLAEIRASQMQRDHPGTVADTGEEEKHAPASDHQHSKQSLIDKFIREEPRISKPHATFFNPTESAAQSNFDDEGIVSETLAQLYAEQGNTAKAIHIYEKLSLLNQEKSRYFAAQIKKLSS